ncbi:DNA cytosine methyltransferase [Paenibacillus alkaliterrae]|uniref:DNA cytosine methyltransferase n=1 Tax=Paenibacillus alkaliterrae TaxID=320909 RepID=UPI001F20437D|nr:DNA cytosine methyltransferase [Paenibacillus alkaliterrae]MCF2941534.1 DNA cytosine methyltransferase [Paenibacillus alkaliterrae]
MKTRLLLQKVYTVSSKREKPRLWLQHLVCEAANFKPGTDLFIRVNEEDKTIMVQNRPYDDGGDVHEVSVSSRVNRVSGQPRPLVDASGEKFSTVLCIQDKIEISVYRNGDYGQVIVRPLRFRLFESETFGSPADERLRLLSICAGSGIGSSLFVDTSYYTATMEVELEEDSASVLKHNFPYSFLFNGDLRDCNTVAKADVAFVSLDCAEFSSLGNLNQGYFSNLILGTYKILKAAEARVIFYENVPQFYQSTAYNDLQQLLSHEFPYQVGPIRLESHAFGSIARRDRSYAVSFRDKEDFDLFRIPKPPAVRHKRLKEFLDPRSTVHVWKSLDRWMDSFKSKAEKNNSWSERNIDKTFVDENATEIQCIPRRYRSHCASNSYVLSDDRKSWRFLTISELRRIFSIPEWFEFPAHIPVYRIYEMIGQSVCGRVIRAFANEISSVFFRRYAIEETPKREENNDHMKFSLDQTGQIGFVIS